MHLALSAGSLHNRPLEEAFDLAAEAGFDGMEVIIGARFTLTQPECVALLQRVQHTLPVLSIHAPFFEVDGWGGKANQLQRTVDLAGEAGVPLVTFHPPSWLALEWSFRRWLGRFDDIQQELGQGQVTLAIENMPPGGPGYMLSKRKAMLRYLQKKNLYLTFDTAHMGASTPDLAKAFHPFHDAGRVRNIHFSDFLAGREHLWPGRGELPMQNFLHCLKTCGYDRTLVLELVPTELPESLDGIKHALASMVEWLRHPVPVKRPPEQ